MTKLNRFVTGCPNAIGTYEISSYLRYCQRLFTNFKITLACNGLI